MKSLSLMPQAPSSADPLAITVLRRLNTRQGSRYFGLHLSLELVRDDFKRWTEAHRGPLQAEDPVAAYHQAEEGYGRYYPLNVLREALLNRPDGLAAARASARVKAAKLVRPKTAARPRPSDQFIGQLRKAS